MVRLERRRQACLCGVKQHAELPVLLTWNGAISSMVQQDRQPASCIPGRMSRRRTRPCAKNSGVKRRLSRAEPRTRAVNNGLPPHLPLRSSRQGQGMGVGARVRLRCSKPQ